MKTKKNPNLAMQLPGALALAAAGAATQAHAATVQITFTGSYLSTTGGNQVDTDFGNDGFADLTPMMGDNYGVNLFGGRGAEKLAYAWSVPWWPAGRYAQVGVTRSAPGATATAVARGLPSMMFSDTNIRGGLNTVGYLDTTAMAATNGEKRITVNRLIFDDATGGTIGGLNVNSTYATYVAPSAGGSTSAVPEASTSLGLLALGAGGILTRRRQKRNA